MRTIALLASLALLSCSSSVDLPKGTSKGYTSARLVKPGDRETPGFAEKNPGVNRAIQSALADEFRSHGLSAGTGSADLIVAYLILIQDNFSTTAIDDYFGYGRDEDAIVDRAQLKGVVENQRPDRFMAGTLVIDVMDARTQELVFRNYVTRDLHLGASSGEREARIRQAVAEAMAPFFR